MTGSVQGIRAGRAYVELAADNRKLDTGLATAMRSVGNWVKGAEAHGRRLALFGSLMTGSLVATAKSFAANGVEMAKLRTQTGMQASALAGLKKLAEDTEVPFSELAKSLTKLQQNVAKPSKETAEALEAIGLSADKIRGKKTGEILDLIADRLPKIEDESKRVATAIALFGRSGAAMLPVLERGSQGLREATEEARQLGLVMSDETLDAALKLDDAFDKLEQSTKGLRDAIGEGLVPVLVPLLDKVAGVVKEVGAWTRENPMLAESLFYVAAGITAVGSAMAAAGLLARAGGAAAAFGRGVRTAAGGAAAAAGFGRGAAAAAPVIDAATGTVLGGAAATGAPGRLGMLARGAGRIALPIGVAMAAWDVADVVDTFRNPPRLGGDDLTDEETARMVAAAVREQQGLPPLDDSAPGTSFVDMIRQTDLGAKLDAINARRAAAAASSAAASSPAAASVDPEAAERIAEARRSAIADLRGDFDTARSSVFDRLREGLHARRDISAAFNRVDVLGRFGGVGVSQIGFGQSVEQRELRAAEETARNTRELRDLLRDKGTFQ